MPFKKRKSTTNKMATRKPVKRKSVKKGSAPKQSVSKKFAVNVDGIFRMKIFLGCLAILGVITSVALGIKYKDEIESTAEVLPIRFVELEGSLIHVTRQEIIEKLQKADEQSSEYIGFMESDLQQLEEKIEMIPWVQRAELRRIWPDKLRIKVKEQKAIALWNSESLINEYGALFTPSVIEDVEDLPELAGPEEELSELLDTFREIQKQLTTIDLQLKKLDLNHRYAWQLELDNGIALEIGRKNLMDRVKRFVDLYPLLKSESDLPIEKVDLRYDTGLAVLRLETSERQASL